MSNCRGVPVSMFMTLVVLATAVYSLTFRGAVTDFGILPSQLGNDGSHSDAGMPPTVFRSPVQLT